MAHQQSAFDEQNQPTYKYPTLSASGYENTRPQNIIQKILKNRRQFLSILPGILMLTPTLWPLLWNVYGWYETRFVASLFWFIFIPIGAGVGAFLNGRVAVKTIYFANGVLLLLCGIMYATESSTKFSESNTFLGIVSVVSGFIYGVNHVTVILHAVDNSAKEIRGTVVRWVPYSLHFIQLMVACLSINSLISLSFASVGVIFIIVAIVVLIVTHFFVYNSFVSALEKPQIESDIQREMHMIRNEPKHSERILDDLREMKVMLNEDKSLGCNIFTHGNMKPLLLVIAARLLSCFLNNTFFIVIVASRFILTRNMNILIVLLSKFFIGWIMIFYAERISFNRFYYVAGIIWSSFVIVGGVSHYYFSFREYILYGAAWAIVLGYSFICLGIEAISYNQLSEAFPLNKRAGSIAFVTFAEYIFEIVYMLSARSTEYCLSPFLFGGIITISCYLLKLMPNTHGKTLRRAREMFNDVIAINSIRRKYEGESMPLQSI